MGTLRIFLFGGLHLSYGQQHLPTFPTQKTRSLFAYLVTFRDRPHAREDLARTFWRHSPLDRARRSLNTTVWRLRRIVPPGYLQSVGEQLAFEPSGDYWVDVVAFEQALQQAGWTPGRDASSFFPAHPQAFEALQRAAELYRGDFLDGFGEEWRLVEAERLRSLYLQALKQLLAGYRDRGDDEQALQIAQRLLQLDPLHEQAHQQAIELYARLGRMKDAHTQFETCRRLLREELDVKPMPETVSVYQRICRTSPNAALPPPSSNLPFSDQSIPGPLSRSPFDNFGQVPMVGQEQVWSSLLSRFSLAARGEGGLVMLMGRAGEGKTRLAQELARYAKSRGWLSLWGNCHEFKEPPPYQAWTEALRSALSWLGRQNWNLLPSACLSEITLLLPELGRLLPSLPPPANVPAPQRREQLQQALWGFLLGLGRVRPCLVVLDDLHWADEATLQALASLTRLPDCPLLILGTTRSDEQPPLLHTLLQEGTDTEALQQYKLKPLSRSEVGELSQALLGRALPDALFVERLYQETGGNPFYIIESLKGLYEQGLLSQDRQGRWHLEQDSTQLLQADWPLPRGIGQVVRRRLEQLARNECALLELAAVLGRRMPFDLLWQSSGWSEERVLEVTDELLRRQFLVEGDDALRFVHDHVRQIIYQGIGPARRQFLHRRAGEVLEAYDAGCIEELAHHFFLSRQLERAMPYCLQAGNRAMSLYAYQSALTYYNWIVQAAQELGEIEHATELLRAYECFGYVWGHLGNIDRALENYAAMRQVAQSAKNWAAVARSERRVAWVYGSMLHDWNEGLSRARQAGQLAREAEDWRETVIAMLDTGFFHNMLGQYAQALDTLQQALALSREQGEAGPAAHCLQYIGLAQQALGQYQESQTAFQEALQVFVEIGNRWAQASTWADLGYLYLSMGNLALAEDSFFKTQSVLNDTVSYLGSPYELIGLAAVQRWRGACAKSLEWLDQASKVGHRFEESHYTAALYLFYRSLVHWDLGQIGASLDDLWLALERARQSNTPTLVIDLLNSLGFSLRVLGQVEQSAACHQEGLDLANRSASLSGKKESLVGLGLVHVYQGNLVGGRAHLARSVQLARLLGSKHRATALAALAEGCLVNWDLEPARSLAQKSLGLAEQMDLLPLQVHSLHLLGWALLGLGYPEQARTALEQALHRASPPGYPMRRWMILVGLSNTLAELGEQAESVRLRRQAVSLVQGILDGLEDEDIKRSFKSQGAVRTLLGESEPVPLESGQTCVGLARLGAPTGRHLLPEEQVLVLWTAQVDPLPGEDKVARRRRHILHLLSEAAVQGGDPTEADLAAVLGVSTRTVRSDVAALRASGRTIRTRGGRTTTRRAPA
ncbi:MAG: AAA family ATPase [Chloroflexia bacterium]|nr:AAA family ATPase [Chloroflexia bacterium]